MTETYAPSTAVCRWCGTRIVRHESTGEWWHEALPLDGGYRICPPCYDNGREPIPGARALSSKDRS